jgi:hypothetical protein
MGALYGALQRGRWRGECGCGLLRGETADGARVQAGARDGGFGGCLGGTQIGVFRLDLPLPRHVTLLGGHFGNSKFYRLRNHGTSDGRTLTTPRPVERRVALATSQGPAVAVRAVHNGSSYFLDVQSNFASPYSSGPSPEAVEALALHVQPRGEQVQHW